MKIEIAAGNAEEQALRAAVFLSIPLRFLRQTGASCAPPRQALTSASFCLRVP